MPAKRRGSGGLNPDAFADVGEGAGDGGEVELLGFFSGQHEKSVLEVSDLAGDLGGVRA